MSLYVEVYRCDMQHEYWSQETFDFVLDHNPRELSQGGLVLQRTPMGLRLLLEVSDQGPRAARAWLASDPLASVTIGVHPTDREFYAYSDLSWLAPGRADAVTTYLRVDADGAAHPFEPPEKEPETVGDNEPAPPKGPSRREQIDAPLFNLVIPLEYVLKPAPDGTGSEPEPKVIHTALKFPSREVRWNYILSGRFPLDEIEVYDEAEKFTFVRSPMDTLLSEQRIPLSAISQQKFQLRHVEDSNQVFIARLPSADVRNLNRWADGALTSDIYINY